ncbi:outer dynein arm-docking complex subunit 4-like [Littorina saxatilis]|uniref:outer dynein arm-docking complex subunit 4-like n=1 Tax=Littorina saxatilis TaxID=31220 RepID=UPI0038B571EF
MGDYQLATVYYKKGHKLEPDNPRFLQGIERSAEAQNRFGGGMVSKNKLSAVGDLSFFLNNKRCHTLTDFDEDPALPTVPSGREAELPSAGFRSRNQCPLVRISRKPRFPQLTSFETEDTPVVEAGRLRGLDDDTSKLRQPDEDTMKKILGELYGDRKYLHKLQTDLPRERRTRSDVRRLAREGLEFLRERTTLWWRESVEHPHTSRLPPPPAPIPIPRLSYLRHCGRITAVLRL